MSFPRCFSLFFLYNLSQLLGALALIVASVDFGTEKPNLSGQEKIRFLKLRLWLIGDSSCSYICIFDSMATICHAIKFRVSCKHMFLPGKPSQPFIILLVNLNFQPKVDSLRFKITMIYLILAP